MSGQVFESKVTTKDGVSTAQVWRNRGAVRYFTATFDNHDEAVEWANQVGWKGGV